jgi:hypothetical protein
MRATIGWMMKRRKEPAKIAARKLRFDRAAVRSMSLANVAIAYPPGKDAYRQSF